MDKINIVLILILNILPSYQNLQFPYMFQKCIHNLTNQHDIHYELYICSIFLIYNTQCHCKVKTLFDNQGKFGKQC